MSAGMVAGTIAGTLLPLIGTAIGEANSAEDRRKQREALEAAIAQILGLAPPSIESQELDLEEYLSQGSLTPEQQQVFLQGPSAMQGVSTDPRYKEAELAVLSGLQERSREGITDVEKADLNALHRRAANAAKSQSESVLLDRQRRGMSGGGDELAAQLSGSQAAADQASAEGDRIASMAHQAAYQALIDSGKMASGLRDQEFDEGSKKAAADDVIASYNTKWSNAAAESNTDRRTRASEHNLSAKQTLANSNTDLRNKQQDYNKGLIAKRYDQDVKKADMASGAYKDRSDMYKADADHTIGTWSKIGSTLGKGASSLGSMGMGGSDSSDSSSFEADLDDQDMNVRRRLRRGY